MLCFCCLSRCRQSQTVDFLEGFPLTLRVEGKQGSCLLVYGGLPYFGGERPKDYTQEELLCGPHDFSQTHYEGVRIKKS